MSHVPDANAKVDIIFCKLNNFTRLSWRCYVDIVAVTWLDRLALMLCAIQCVQRSSTNSDR